MRTGRFWVVVLDIVCMQIITYVYWRCCYCYCGITVTAAATTTTITTTNTTTTTESSGKFLPTFRNNLSVKSTPEDGADRLYPQL